MTQYNSVAHVLAARQIDDYLRRHPAAPRAGFAGVAPPRPTITLSFMEGVPVKEVAERVARELGFHVFDREVLEAVERDTGLGDRIVEALDAGKRSALDAWIEGWIDLGHRIVDPQSFHHMVSRIIRGIWLHGGAVIVGRGSNFVLRETDCFKVRLTADPGLRAEALAAATGRDRHWAWREVSRSDARKWKFIHEQFHADLDDPTAYDVTFNLRVLSPEHASRLVLDSFRQVAGQRGRQEAPAPV